MHNPNKNFNDYFKTNEEFIDKSYEFLNKLNEKNLWNKDILVIVLDKSARPLVYTLRKLTKEKGEENPEIKFFNFSSRKYPEYDLFTNNLLSPDIIISALKKEINPKKLSKYKKVIILDDISSSGNTLKRAESIFKNYFSELENKPELILASLISHPENKISLISGYKSNNIPSGIGYNSNILGIEDENEYVPGGIPQKPIEKSVSIKDKEIYSECVNNRRQLSSDIKKYVESHNLKRRDDAKFGNLENIIRISSFILLIFGLIIGYNGITGNIIGNFSKQSNFIGIILIALGIFGLIFSRKLK